MVQVLRGIPRRWQCLGGVHGCCFVADLTSLDTDENHVTT
jgi:hypothetical protein